MLVTSANAPPSDLTFLKVREYEILVEGSSPKVHSKVSPELTSYKISEHCVWYGQREKKVNLDGSLRNKAIIEDDGDYAWQ